MIKHAICLAAIATIAASWGSVASAENYYRLKEVVVPAFVTDTKSKFFNPQTQGAISRKEGSAKWIKFQEKFYAEYIGFRNIKNNLGQTNYTIDFAAGKASVRRYNDTVKDVFYDWEMTFTVPPRLIKPETTFDLTSTVKGPVYVDHYGGAQPPMMPIYYSDKRLKFKSASGLGNPMMYSGQPWKWPKLQPKTSGSWSGTGRFGIDEATDNNGRNPFTISVAIPKFGHMISQVIFVYEVVSASEVAGNDSGGVSNGRNGSSGRSGSGESGAGRSGTRVANNGTSGTGRNGARSGSSNTREVIREEGTRHGTPPSRNAATSRGSSGAGSSSGAGTILEANKVRVRSGETVRVRVNLLNARDISNMNFDVRFQSSVARPVGKAIKGGLLSSMRFENNPAQQGKIRVGFASESGVNGSGSVAYIEFKATGQPGDRTPISFDITTVNQPDGRVPSVRQVPGEILIVGPGGFVPGDTNGDGVLNELDAGDALKMSVELIPVDLRADIDQDGQVTSRDATLIMQAARN